MIYCLAGRSLFLDGGMRLYRIEPKTGKLIAESIWDDLDPETKENMQSHIMGMAMPPALSDVLASDGRKLYMRSQVINMDGSRSFEKITAKDYESKQPHLFSAAGFLDDSWFHRVFWTYGIESGNGWGGWSKPALTVPIGRILSVADGKVYGFGRRPAFFIQATVMEYQLYSANPRFDEEYMKDIRKVTRDSGRLIDNWLVNNKLPAESLTLVDYNWRLEGLPLLGRALVVADKTLFVAGPPDVLDEIKAFGHFKDEDILKEIREQEAAFDGKSGGLLWAVSREDGKRLAEYKLDWPPIFDGMAAADGKLFIADMDGNITCFSGM
jgi:outer membrane protein assembly factor BamB